MNINFNNNQYYQNKDDNQNKQNNSSSDAWSWIIIIALALFGLWPVSAVLIFIKLFGKKKRIDKNDYAPSLSREEELRKREEIKKEIEREIAAQKTKDKIKSFFRAPKEDKKSAYLQIGLGILLAIVAITSMADVAAAEATLGSIIFLISAMCSCFGLILNGTLINGALKRYAQYLSIIGNKDAMELSSIANKTGYKLKRVEKDISKMIEKGYFGQTAYINKELGYFFVSSQADEELVKAKADAMTKAKEAASKEAMKQNANIYEQLIYQIRDVNNRIPGEVMTGKITQLENITKHIFDIVQSDPNKRPKIDRFMSYYLPTTLKLLDHYAQIDSTKIEGENITQSKKSIESAMDSIVDGFQRQLDDLYKTEVLDIETDIDVLKQMMANDNKNKKSDFDISDKNKPLAGGGH